MKTSPQQYPFLQGGGEMGTLISAFPWETTAIGTIDTWPVSLKNSIGLILSSRFPMFLWWGESLVQFYNDDYRNILGEDGKHPSALGQTAKECWTKVWDDIHPLIKQVKQGDSVWFEDMPLPVYRNGVYEDGYWTFSYSPVRNDLGYIEGILVVCTETTEKVNSIKNLTESRDELEFAIEAAELGVFDYNPANNKFSGNDRLKNWFGLAPADEIPLSTAIESIAEKDRQKVTDAIANVLQYESGGKYDIEYDIINPHTGIVTSVHAKGRTWFDENNMAYRFNGTLQDITERVEIDKRLAKSEENLRNIIMKAPAAMCIFRGENHVVEIANERILELWGKTADDVLAKPQFEGLPEARFQGFEELLDSVYQNGESFAAQGVPVTLPRNGEVKTVFVNFAFEPYYDTEGIITGIIAVAIDVTQQATAAEKLRLSEERLRAVLESAPFPIGIYEGREMRIALLNQSIIDVWDKGNDLIGKTYFEVLPELETQDIYPKLLEVFDTGKPYCARNERVDLMVDGKMETYYFNYDFTPLFDAAGNVYGVMNTAADVTDLNVAKLEVEQSIRNFRNMILRAPVAMCILLGPQHVVDIANEMMLELWGKPVNDIMQRPIFDGLPDARNQGLEQLLDNVYATGETFTASEMPVNLLRNGVEETVYQNFVYQPYRDGSGEILGVLAITIDVSAQVMARREIEAVVKLRTEELQHANANLQRSNAELAQFAYIASHDLQEPVRKISIFAQMLGSRIGQYLDESSQNFLEKISLSATRMQALIRDVLTYSELVKKSDVYDEVDLTDIAKGTVTDYELMIEQKHATVNFDKLPTIDAIPLQMSQLFGNLVSNSLKYSRPGVNPVINITAEKVSHQEILAMELENRLYYKIRFEDNGIGFGQEYADKIFNIFQRLHGKTDYSGTGIGLAICKKIVNNHSGYISASSVEGQGATFTIILPAKQKDTD